MRQFCYVIMFLAFFFYVSGCARNLRHTSSFDHDDLENQIVQAPQPPELASIEEVSLDSDEIGKIQEAIVEQAVVEMEEPDEKLKPENKIDSEAAEQQVSQLLLDEALEHCQLSHNLRKQGKLDEALKALDQAYLLISEVNTDDLPGFMQQKEDLRFMISKRILEIYAARGSVVTGHYKAIPITLNRYTQREIDSFTTGREKRFFIESYKRSGRYRKQIVEELKAAGLPVELSWLPLIESGFKARALSKARALGLWQFIPSTGYKFGLKRDTYVDERLDPEKATKAAILYLKELHQLFGDWSTVLAAYNCGEGRVLRIIRGQNVNYLDNFWDLYEKLPRETARYVPRFLACLHIINHPEQYGLEDIIVDPPMEYDSIPVRKQFHLEDAAKAMDLSKRVLTDLNPELRYQILPEKEYLLRVPLNSGSVLLDKFDEIPVSRVVRKNFVYHRVKTGETLSTIARRYRTNVKKIARANKIRRFSYIVAGNVLKIPQRGSYHTRTSKQNPAPIQSDGNLHLYNVKAGDSLWVIARKYGTTVRNIRKVNNLQHNRLRVGQVLKIPNQASKHLVNANSLSPGSKKTGKTVL